MPDEPPVMRVVLFEKELLMFCSFELKTSPAACGVTADHAAASATCSASTTWATAPKAADGLPKASIRIAFMAAPSRAVLLQAVCEMNARRANLWPKEKFSPGSSLRRGSSY
jgi:hypothetical protein